jgi:hypothetical protein
MQSTRVYLNSDWQPGRGAHIDTLSQFAVSFDVQQNKAVLYGSYSRMTRNRCMTTFSFIDRALPVSLLYYLFQRFFLDDTLKQT